MGIRHGHERRHHDGSGPNRAESLDVEAEWLGHLAVRKMSYAREVSNSVTRGTLAPGPEGSDRVGDLDLGG